MNGFAPLFSALDPKQVNDLAQGFVDTFAGRKSVHLLLRQIASMGQNPLPMERSSVGSSPI